MRPIVATTAGRVRGIERDGVCAFLGVPYAAPPLGPLRFAPPAPPAPWTGERDASAFGPAPPQRPDALVTRLGLFPDGPQDEDCLRLNVWTPDPAGRRAMMVWLHGGAFVGGAAGVPLYDGARLAREGDVVVVSVGYRVGALGFLALGPGRTNVGLLDQLEALRFVQRHAAAFGGDPARVAVFGESAGAGSVCALLAMPGARGLFARAIVQSGAPAGVLRPAEAVERAAKLLGKLGLGPEDRERLASLPVAELLDAQERTLAEGPFAKGMLFMPVVDGEVLPQAPLDAVAAGSAREVDLVVGTTREEMHLFQLVGMGDWATDALLPRIVAAQLVGEVEDPAAAAERLVAGLRRALLARGEDASAPALFYALQTELGVRGPSIGLAEAHAASGGRTWMYLFNWPSPMQAAGRALRACHALDLPFTFGTLGAPRMAEFAGLGPDAERLSATLRAAWTAFARSGDPSPPGLTWPRYDPRRRATLELGPVCRVVDAPLEDERAALAEAFAPRASGGAGRDGA
ncbi:MAG TPA: carboxylesterase family protein [Myxococcota bacterium]|nr:carboxylesterase family protein [Myxococcota bacterium]